MYTDCIAITFSYINRVYLNEKTNRLTETRTD